MRNTIILIISFLIFTLQACDNATVKQSQTNTSQLTKEAPQMYQASELAVLMREIKEDMSQQKALIEAGGDFDEKLLDKFIEIKTAAPTSKNDTIGPYHGYADAFLNILSNLNNAENKVIHFNLAIETCVSCHQNYCQGPIPAIKKLSLTAAVQ